MSLYPIELDLNGRTALVVGLGSVGRRKAAGLVAAGAAVIGIDPAVTSETCPESVSPRVEPYHERHLEGVSLVVAACTPEVNRRVVADARAAGLWVNSASEPGSSDFFLPAVWRSGGILLTVSTSGASPALARMLRDRAAEALGKAAAGLAATLADLRPIVLARVENPEIRRKILNNWGNPRWLDLFAKGGATAVRGELTRVLDKFLEE